MRFGFAGFELDSERFALTRNREAVPIEPKPLKLLIHLLVRHPATVPKEEFLEALWPGERVTGASLTRAVRAARIALGKAAGDAIVTVRGRGYRIGVPVERIDGDPRSGAAGRRAFVGRAELLVELRAEFERACEGRGGVALLSGEPGIGKTRTAEELARQCAEAGAEVAWGRAYRDEGMPALWPWLRLLGSLVRGRPAETLKAQLGRGTAAIARVVPEVRERLPRLPEPETLAPEQERFRFFEAVTRFLDRAASARPLLLVLDDLHEADTASLQLLAFAGETLSRARVLLLGTHRDVGAPPTPALDAALGALARAESPPVSLALDGLSEDEVGRLLSVVAPEHACSRKAREIHIRSGGNPFFVRELARLLAQDGGAAATVIPPNVRAAIRARLAGLRDGTRQALASASVIGRDFAPSILADVAQRARAEIEEALDEGESSGFVCGAEEAPGCYRFAHPLVQETIYASLTRVERARLHERAGESIVASHEGRLEPHLASLARHFDEASLRGGDERAVTYAERAARQDRARHAFGEAAEHYRRALRALERSASRDLERRCDLLLELGEALLLDGASAEAMASFDEAADVARSADDGARLARAALARSAAVTPVLPDPVALERVREALDRLGEGDPSLHLRLRARLATLLCASGEFEGAVRLETEVVGATDRLADADAVCDVLLEHLFVQQQHALVDGSDHHLALTDRILARAGEAHRLDAELAARRIRIAEFVRIGETAEVDGEIHAFARASDRVAIRSQRHYAAAFLAMRALDTGRFRHAERWIDAAEQLADPRDPTEARFTPATQRLLLPRASESRRDLERTIRGLVRDFPMVRQFRVMLARFYQEAGRRERARRLVDEIAARGLEAYATPHPGWLVGLVSLIRVLGWLGDPFERLCRPFYERLAPYAGTNVVVGGGILCDGPVDDALALVAAARGRFDEAARHFEAALAMEARMGSRPSEVRTRRDYARLLRRRNAAGCEESARRQLARADALAREIGLEPAPDSDRSGAARRAG